jgi:hypothetical protein
MHYVLGSEGIAPPFLNLTLDAKWPASCPCHFKPSTLWIGSWVCPRACVDTVENRRISCKELNPNHSFHTNSLWVLYIAYFVCYLAQCYNYNLHNTCFLDEIIVSTNSTVLVVAHHVKCNT